jgi:site-specific recombinase XerD
MTTTIKDILWKYLKQYDFLMITPDAYLFFQQKTYPLGKHPISRQMLWVYMKQWCHMTRVSDEFSADSLRRTRAHYAYQKGFSLEQIQDRLGFASLDMTKSFL